ncbi:MAG TPA: helix-turn-helix transcriptional regulator [Gemmatimonadaceae bacterium]|nr:helix-turn-helix transcriptional regulator [Gemmatimonadaceae bacterium]
MTASASSLVPASTASATTPISFGAPYSPGTPGLTRLAGAVRVASSPLAFPSRESWYRALGEQLRELCGGDAALFVAVTTSVASVFDAFGPVVCYARDERDPVAPLGAVDVDVLALVAPAFAAGLATLDRLEAARVSLGAALDALSDGAAVFAADGTGRELYRNRALDRWLATDAATLPAALADAVHHAARAADGPAPRGAPPATAGGRYRLAARLLAPGAFDRATTVLVVVERTGAALPSADVLRARFGLTPREAEVALRLAVGDSDGEVAGTLGVSHHTVRHHAESIFTKLEVHSRKALALVLLGDRDGPAAGAAAGAAAVPIVR